MPKLTAQRARERIEQLKRWRDQRGLTLREEEYLEALEIAADMLEAKPVCAISERALNELSEGMSVSAHPPGYAEHRLIIQRIYNATAQEGANDAKDQS